MARKRQNHETVPLHEELDALCRHYHHLQVEHQGKALESSTRRRIEERLLEVRERFDRALAEWVPDEGVQQQWREYLDHHAPEPADPPSIRPLVFRGVSDAGSIAEVRRKNGDLALEVDGSLVERIAAEKDFAANVPPVRLRVDGMQFTEVFDASSDALDALSDFLDGDGASPPWEHARELLADGLADVHFAVTPRGRRALAEQAL